MDKYIDYRACTITLNLSSYSAGISSCFKKQYGAHTLYMCTATRGPHGTRQYTYATWLQGMAISSTYSVHLCLCRRCDSTQSKLPSLLGCNGAFFKTRLTRRSCVAVILLIGIVIVLNTYIKPNVRNAHTTQRLLKIRYTKIKL